MEKIIVSILILSLFSCKKEDKKTFKYASEESYEKYNHYYDKTSYNKDLIEKMDSLY
jgi:hypothetical protein